VYRLSLFWTRIYVKSEEPLKKSKNSLSRSSGEDKIHNRGTWSVIGSSIPTPLRWVPNAPDSEGIQFVVDAENR
jgi:hypothetical protein